jgi:hypothetical protein
LLFSYLESNEIRIRLKDGDIIATFERKKAKRFHEEFLAPGTKLRLHGRITKREVPLIELCRKEDMKEFIPKYQTTFVYCIDVKKYKTLDNEGPQESGSNISFL